MNLWPLTTGFLLLGLSVADNLWFCSKFPDINNTFTVSHLSETPPTRTNSTYYVNPCAPINIPECADDDHLCTVKQVEIDEKWIVSAILPYGSASNGAQINDYAGDEFVGIHYFGAKWGTGQFSQQLAIRCGPSTELSVEEIHHGAYIDHQLTLKTPSLCGFHSDAPIHYGGLYYKRRWSAWHIVGVVILIVFLTLFGGIITLWLFLKFSHRRGELTAEFGLPDALHDLISGLSFSIAGICSRGRSPRR